MCGCREILLLVHEFLFYVHISSTTLFEGSAVKYTSIFVWIGKTVT
jgi:hypothetical protein